MLIKLSLKDKRLNKRKDVQKWLRDCEKLLASKQVSNEIDEVVINAIFSDVCSQELSPPTIVSGKEFNIN